MSRPRKVQPPTPVDPEIPGYDTILIGMVDLLEASHRSAARAVNAVMTATYWEVGRRVVEHEQGGSGAVPNTVPDWWSGWPPT